MLSVSAVGGVRVGWGGLRVVRPVRSMYATNVDERQFFSEKPEDRHASYQCPQCRRTNEYSVRWIRRTKKAQPPPGSDERARAMFNKVKDYLVRVDEHVTCKPAASGSRFPRTAISCSSRSSKVYRKTTTTNRQVAGGQGVGG